MGAPVVVEAEWLSVADTARALGISRHTLYRWIRDPAVPTPWARKLGPGQRGVVRVSRRELDAALAGGGPL